MAASFLKCVSGFTASVFYVSEKELLSWTYLLKKRSRRTKILISPVWNKILKIWDNFSELIQIEAQCSKNDFTFFCRKKLELLKKHRKRTAEATPKNEKKFLKKKIEKIFVLSAIQCKWLFFANIYSFCKIKTQIFSLWR